ncbi:unnamed protein product [Soboliphyme baturini]|uniref:Tetraspanin-12 n=1 Tax=Soboliphyme baturini TaxID=241478 RepID=A0A183IUB4_9BILA|nr:unnamed protein product [Soboliphyme baturini]
MMVLGCGARMLKFCLFAFNLVFFIAGTVCLGVGLWMVLDNQALERLVNAAEEQSSELRNLVGKPEAVRDIGIVLASGGGVIFAIAFLGCCGAAKEWRPLLVLVMPQLANTAYIQMAHSYLHEISYNLLVPGTCAYKRLQIF